MARWYRLEKLAAPIKWKTGTIGSVLHVWPERPPSDEQFARHLSRQILLLFSDDLVRLQAKRVGTVQSPIRRRGSKKRQDMS